MSSLETSALGNLTNGVGDYAQSDRSVSERREEELQREGGVDVGHAEIVGRTPWELFWLRFRRDRVALASLVFIVLLVLVAILAAPLEDKQPGHLAACHFPLDKGEVDKLIETPEEPAPASA